MEEILQTTISITAFVLFMMLIIEFVNVKTQGAWDKHLRKSLWMQILFASLFGAIPGCLGVYTVVSLFTHKIIGFGALVSAMIATAGDEAFIMFGMMPQKAFLILIISLILAIVTGLIVSFFKDKALPDKGKLETHKTDLDNYNNPNEKFNRKDKKIGLLRSIMLLSLLLLAINMFVGKDHHNHTFDVNQEVFSKSVLMTDVSESHKVVSVDSHDENHLGVTSRTKQEVEEEHLHLPKILFLILILVSGYIILTSSEHFINEHVWNHVVKKHFLRIFLWTLGTLLFIYLIKNTFVFDVAQLVNNNLWIILFLAILIGIVPESGPHMIFISLFIAGVVPFSILLANSIVQDGHGSLPLFAEDKKSFFRMKVINLLVGFLAGAFGLCFGF